MLLYNVTVNIDKDAETEWLQWVKQQQIPAIMDTGLFTGHKLYRLVNEEYNDGTTYAMQFFARTLDDVEKYLTEFAPVMAARLQESFKDRHVAFQTLLESVP